MLQDTVDSPTMGFCISVKLPDKIPVSMDIDSQCQVSMSSLFILDWSLYS